MDTVKELREARLYLNTAYQDQSRVFVACGKGADEIERLGLEIRRMEDFLDAQGYEWSACKKALKQGEGNE